MIYSQQSASVDEKIWSTLLEQAKLALSPTWMNLAFRGKKK